MYQVQQITQVPNFFNVLSEVDRYQYHMLRASFHAAQANKNQRNKRVENFTEGLEAIKRYCVRGDGDDWRRSLVCGVCWLPEGIAINTRQLKILIFKCKSSINGSLHKMGYTVNLGRSEAANAICSKIPLLKENLNELRQWTVRQAGPECVSPISPPPQVFNTQKPFEIPIINIQPKPKPKPLPIPNINFPIPKIEQCSYEPTQIDEPIVRDDYYDFYSNHQPSYDFMNEPAIHEDFW